MTLDLGRLKMPETASPGQARSTSHLLQNFGVGVYERNRVSLMLQVSTRSSAARDPFKSHKLADAVVHAISQGGTKPSQTKSLITLTVSTWPMP